MPDTALLSCTVQRVPSLKCQRTGVLQRGAGTAAAAACDQAWTRLLGAHWRAVDGRPTTKYSWRGHAGRHGDEANASVGLLRPPPPSGALTTASRPASAGPSAAPAIANGKHSSAPGNKGDVAGDASGDADVALEVAVEAGGEALAAPPGYMGLFKMLQKYLLRLERCRFREPSRASAGGPAGGLRRGPQQEGLLLSQCLHTPPLVLRLCYLAASACEGDRIALLQTLTARSVYGPAGTDMSFRRRWCANVIAARTPQLLARCMLLLHDALRPSVTRTLFEDGWRFMDVDIVPGGLAILDPVRRPAARPNGGIHQRQASRLECDGQPALTPCCRTDMLAMSQECMIFARGLHFDFACPGR
jgi:hypothetical protein